MRPEVVYLLRIETGAYKIGRSREPEARARAVVAGVPLRADIIHRIQTDDATWLERRLHDRYAHSRLKGEWFQLTDEEVAEILTIKRRDRRDRSWAGPVPKGYDLGTIVRAMRAAKGMTAVELASKANISRIALYRIESGRSGAHWDTVCAIADALGVDIGSLRVDVNETEHPVTG